MMNFKTALIAIICMLSIGCIGQTTKVETIVPAAFAQKLKATPNAQLLDVRTPAEFTDQHLENSVNVDWNSPDFEAKAATYDKSKPVFVYCKSGGRSLKAAQKLEQIGFTKVYNLDGGILKWNAQTPIKQ